jgi:hypothetical protein
MPTDLAGTKPINGSCERPWWNKANGLPPHHANMRERTRGHVYHDLQATMPLHAKSGRNEANPESPHNTLETKPMHEKHQSRVRETAALPPARKNVTTKPIGHVMILMEAWQW